MKVSAENARRFLVTRHFLAPARSLRGGKDAVLAVVEKLGSIQFDPIAVAGRNHDLVLHARVANYDPAWMEELFEQRAICEAYNKGLSFVSTREFPLFRGILSRRPAQLLDDHADVAKRVLARIRKDGAVSTADFERERGGTTDWFGAPSNTVREVLEALTLTGKLGLARRDGNRRYYDLIDRLLPANVLKRKIPLEEQLRHKMLSRYRAHGLLGTAGVGDVYAGLGPDKPDPRVPGYVGRAALREQIIERGDLVPVEIEGLRGKRFVLREEVAALESPPEPPPSVAFLPPFDALVWDRPFLKNLFEFEYVWELFHPPEKRRWGWYVLPMVFRDRFVGRIEPRIDREAGRVEILDLWWEDDFAWRRADGFVDAMRDALGAYARFAGAGKLDWPSHLTAEKRALKLASASRTRESARARRDSPARTTRRRSRP
jgi:uncharacterized protein